MTEIQPAHFTEGACHTAVGDRQVLSSLVCSQGVTQLVGDELAVVQRAAGANMSVDVGSGNAFVEGTQVGWQGMYHVSNDGTVNVPVDAADGFDDRIDYIAAVVKDATYAGTDREWEIAYLPGVASPAPAPPTLPDNAVLLATINVSAGATSITTTDIVDERVWWTSCTGGGGLMATLVFTSNDTFDKADYPGLGSVDVEVQGSGGGGGGASTTDPSYGAGGGSGGYCRATLDESLLGPTTAITVGAGGAGGVAGTSGSNGATSSFGSLIACAGGQGGDSQDVSGVANGGGGGNVPSPPAGSVEIEGQYGDYGWVADIGADKLIHSGKGADSALGLGGASWMLEDTAPINNNGRPGSGYGSGGGGALDNQAFASSNGGAGAGGVVIVRVYR